MYTNMFRYIPLLKVVRAMFLTVTKNKLKMNKLFIIVLISFLNANAYSQIEPTQNYEKISLEKQLKNIKTIYYATEDTTKSEGRLLFKKEFDEDGKIISKYIYTFFDIVSYDHTSTYKYDTNENLVEKTIIQRILNLGKRDAKYISFFGDEPINEKYFYEYDNNNNCIKEIVYSHGKESLNKTNDLNKTIEYFYNKKNELIKEISKTPNGKIISDNYTMNFDYSNGKKIKQTKYFSEPHNYKIETTFKYNSQGFLVKEETIDYRDKRNNGRIQYKYDDNNNLIVGNDSETAFDYYKNGLIKQELWKSKTSEETVNYITFYKFYK